MTQTITNRQLMREFPRWRAKLLEGKVDALVIPQNGGMEIRIVVAREMTPLERQLEWVNKHPLKSLKRPQRDII